MAPRLSSYRSAPAARDEVAAALVATAEVGAADDVEAAEVAVADDTMDERDEPAADPEPVGMPEGRAVVPVADERVTVTVPEVIDRPAHRAFWS